MCRIKSKEIGKAIKMKMTMDFTGVSPAVYDLTFRPNELYNKS